MRMLSVLAALFATASPAVADRTRARGGFGIDAVAYHGTDGELFGEDYPETQKTGGGYVSITNGDGRGLDAEARIASQILVSIVEVRARAYVVDNRLYLYSGLGAAFFLFIPSDGIVDAGVGLALGDSHIELEVGGMLVYGSMLADHTEGRVARGSIGVRF
jgi:hypothetical protein